VRNAKRYTGSRSSDSHNVNQSSQESALLNSNLTNTTGVVANSVATANDQGQLGGPATSAPATATI
jgi:hypothetical protein